MFKRFRISWSTLLAPLTIATLLVLGICSALYLPLANEAEFTTLDNESRRVERFVDLFAGDVNSAVRDLRLLASGDSLQSYLATGQPADLERAVHRAVFFSRDNPDYDQIRYLDENGREVIRVNQNGEIVPVNQLQNKADRPYFQLTNALGPDQVYLSAIDLNVEKGAVEQPIKPMLRLAMPVFDANGRRRGVFIINYRIENVITTLRQFVPRYAGRFRLLNAQGYWLAAAKPGDEWGFMLPARADANLAKTNPGLWAQIVQNPAGQTPYRGGYFTWRRAVPRDFSAGKPVTLVAEDDYLVFASQISAGEWASTFAGLRQMFVVVGFLLLILTTVLAWIFHARQRARQERDRFFSLTRDMLCVAGFDGYFKRLNPAWRKALGYTDEELMAKPFIDFVHPADKEKTAAETSNLARGGEVISFENRYRCKDGSYRWFVWSARSLVEDQLIYASARDMTERKQIEESLRQSEERSRSIIDGAYDAYISIDGTGRITNWNRQAESMFGWTRAEAAGRFLHETIIPERFHEAHLRGIRRFHATGEGPVLNKAIELVALHKNQQEFPVELIIWPLKLGDEVSFHAFVRDISSRKSAEQQVLTLNEELKQRADLLGSANKELEAFSYSVSHDLRAPLRHIHGFVEMLQKSPAIQGDQGSLRQTTIIAKAAKEMGMLIDDLLAFSRTSRAEMHPIQVNMREMIDQILRDRATECEGRRITWEIKPLSLVAGDPGLLRLVWTNLLDNALKYTRRCEEAKIEIGELADDANADANGTDRHEMVFYIRDNGVGFDMQYASKLFGVFQRLHRAADFEGTGIGLANVQRIIHRHGGRVWAEAKVDAGATFYFSLPQIAPPNQESHDGQN
jgi:PAS domain S-box-containing protein